MQYWMIIQTESWIAYYINKEGNVALVILSIQVYLIIIFMR